MKKALFAITALVILILAGGYYLGFHTYFIKTEVDEDFPIADNSTPATQPQTLAVGSFREVDFVHKGSGEAKLVEVNNKTVLRLEDFTVTNGPDLYVYLSDSQNPTNNIQDLGNYVDLGLLKATSGNQNYDVPSGFEEHRTAIIWCKKFGVLFSFAIME